MLQTKKYSVQYFTNSFSAKSLCLGQVNFETIYREINKIVTKTKKKKKKNCNILVRKIEKCLTMHEPVTFRLEVAAHLDPYAADSC